MRTKFKHFIIGFLTASVLTTSIGVYAGDLGKTIDVLMDSISIVMDGKPKQVSNLLYDGSTYIKLRDLSYVFGKDVEWDGTTRTAYIDEKDAVKLKLASPMNGQQDFYPRYNYLHINFSCDMKGATDLSKVILSTDTGERADIRYVAPGTTYKNTIVFELSSDLKLDTTYKLYIPADTLEAADGKLYNRVIDIKFKTAKTVLKGRLLTSLSSSEIKSFTITGNVQNYNVQIYEDLVFFVTDLEGGKYTIKITDINGKVYEKEVLVQEGMLNKADLSVW